MNFSIISYGTRENFGLCFLDAEEYFFNGLTKLGHTCSFTYNSTADYYLVFGWHLNSDWRNLPREKVIVVQLENLITGNMAAYFFSDIFKGYRVWDYSRQNIDVYRGDAASVQVFNYGFSAPMQEFHYNSIPSAQFDIYFVGSRTPRRNAIFQQLEQYRVTMLMDFGKFGKEVDDNMRKCRAVISPHAYEMNDEGKGYIPATLRISYALNQGMPVFAERSGDEETDAYWSQFVTLFDAGNAAATIIETFDMNFLGACDKTYHWRTKTSMPNSLRGLVFGLSSSPS